MGSRRPALKRDRPGRGRSVRPLAHRPGDGADPDPARRRQGVDRSLLVAGGRFPGLFGDRGAQRSGPQGREDDRARRPLDPMRSKTHLHMVLVDSGIRRPLTGGPLSASGLFSSVASPVSPDGRRLMFVTSEPDYTNRPYVRTEISVLDLSTGKVDRVFSTPFSITGPQWMPDGQRILFAGGQSIGQTQTAKKLRNDYEMDLYLLDPRRETCGH